MKIKFKVQTAGPYDRIREWPVGEGLNNQSVFMILCNTSYSKDVVLSGEHAPLKLAVRIHRDDENEMWDWKYLKRTFNSLEELKSFVKNDFIHPQKNLLVELGIVSE